MKRFVEKLCHLFVLLAALIIALALLAAVAGLLSGCTVAPMPLRDRTASYDEYGQPTSGYLGFHTNAAGTALIVTDTVRQRWNALVPGAGARLVPPAVTNEQFAPFTNGTWRLPLRQVFRFNTMNRWHHQLTP